MNDVQKLKRKVRSSKEWKELRHKMKSSQKLDPLTLRPLTSGFNLHHRDLDEKNYADLRDTSHFVCLNKMSHDVLHFAYNVSKRIGIDEFLDALRNEIQTMVDINEK